MVVGLGNPGKKYTATRHNIGFIFLDYLARQAGVTFMDSKLQSKIVKTMLWGVPVLLVEPQTYMNLSGIAVAKTAAYYKIDTERIVVIHDDLDLPLGRIKIAVKRGAGGHKGIRSIIEHLGSREFPRIRFGIGRPEGRIPTEKYVLSQFREDEKRQIKDGLKSIEEGARLILTEGLNNAMNVINSGQYDF